MDPDPVDPTTLIFNGTSSNPNVVSVNKLKMNLLSCLCKNDQLIKFFFHLDSVETYQPVEYHWFFKRGINNNEETWFPFSKKDSKALEENYALGDKQKGIVPTDGGRFDVDLKAGTKVPVYWSENPSNVRRCSWFFKSSTLATYQPYDEEVAAHLEAEYKSCFSDNKWHKHIELPNKDKIVFHSHDVIVLFPPSVATDDYAQQTQVRPRVVRRGVEEFEIDEGEPEKVDHLLFIVHGIGSVCDLKFRSVQEVVDDFRSISLQLVRTHYQSSFENGAANRVEVLPIGWHNNLHSDETGVDDTLKSITLESMPGLRRFTNNTLLDILFYTSPKYCQRIISTIGNELNRLYETFKRRNPTFDGHVSLGGHSLGSLILFDLLAHQQPPDQERSTSKRPNRRISHMYGAMDVGIPRISYPHLLFQPSALFAMGSPIGMFITVRGLDSLGEDFVLPTCANFFNIFHPNDPVAYRVESLVNPKLASIKPMLVPHHKGRKRMHLELKETMTRVGADLKQRVINSVKQTWNTLFHLGIIPVQANPLEEAEESRNVNEATNDDIETNSDHNDIKESLGLLNNGRRIDYVLQESPFEILNEYLSAITSHLCYWESEDTILFILKEIYSTIQVRPDNKVPQATMTIERPLESSGSRRGSSVN